jgi:hypothetical protein
LDVKAALPVGQNREKSTRRALLRLRLLTILAIRGPEFCLMGGVI